MLSDVLENLTVLAIASTLIYASYKDLVSREIPELSWAPAYLIVLTSLVVRYLSGVSLISAAIALTPPLIYGALFALGMIGGADFLAVLLVSLGHINEPLVPLLVFVASSIAPLPIVLVNLVRNLTIDRKAMASVTCIKGSKKMLYFVGRLTTVANFLKMKFAFLHTYPEEEGFVCVNSVNVNVDFEEQKRSLENAVSRGLIKPGDHVICSPALPHVVFIAVSYAVALLLAQYLRDFFAYLS
ncbi:MAG: hypothetical protein RMH84_03240 [Sulfolobales archaeon]|nr:hypothetical protein [Sulfolobales archaeon]MCX8208104.1 hypothetical protein [Sulfolobales archaeon]MDW8010592.1 hypothetical protein [Sulfolobales archaeon]